MKSVGHTLTGTTMGLIATAPPDVDRTPLQRVELPVRDDGPGFQTTAIQPGYHSLSIIRGCASAIGAALTVESQPDPGTETVVTWEERQ